MKRHGILNDKGTELSGREVYALLIGHMGMFGYVGFRGAYFPDESAPEGLYPTICVVAIVIYLIFYYRFFGIDRIKWIFINSALAFYGIVAEMDLILSWSGKNFDDYSYAVHAFPFVFYILYTFLIWQALLDLTKSRNNKKRRRIAQMVYVLFSVVLYSSIWSLNKA